MASSRNPSTRTSPSLSTATAKTRSVIQDLQSRLEEVSHLPGTRFAAGASAAPALKETEKSESEEDMERELEAYFARHLEDCGGDASSHTQIRDELRSRVIDAVVERILNEWAGSTPNAQAVSGLRDEVMERLIERVLDQLRASTGAFRTAASS